MSSGSPIVPIRIPKYLLAVLDQVIREMNGNRNEAPFNRTTWILAAIQEKLHKRERSRRRGSQSKLDGPEVIILPEEEKAAADSEDRVTVGHTDNGLAPS